MSVKRQRGFIRISILNSSLPPPLFHLFSALRLKNEADRVVVFERGNLLFIFNFHGENSYTDYRVGTDWAGEYSIALDSDAKEFGGHGRVDHDTKFFTTPMEWNGRRNFLQVSSGGRREVFAKPLR